MSAGEITALVAAEEGIDIEGVYAALTSSGGLRVVNVLDGSENWDQHDGTTSDVFVIACRGDSDESLGLIEDAARAHPERPVIVVHGGSPNGYVRQAFTAGAEDLVVFRGPEAADDLVFAIEKAVARRRRSVGGADGVSPLITVLGPKGGIGKTLLAANLSCALAMNGHSVALVDLDLQFGDLGLALGLEPRRTMYDLATSGGSLDAEKVDAYLATHESGARVLLAPVRPDQAGVVTVDFLRNLYAVLRASHDFVVVDTAPGFTPEVIASIDASSHICLIGMLDALSLKNTKLGIETLDLMGYDHGRIRLVLNRADSNVGISHNDVVGILGRPPDVLVPSHRDVTRSVNEGRPMVLSQSRSEAARAFHQLADLYAGAAVPRPGAADAARRGRGLRLRTRS